MKCPNENCKNHDKGMDNVAPLEKDFVNFRCYYCGCHYYGEPKNPKFYTKQEWQDYVNVVEGIDCRTIRLDNPLNE